MDDRRGAPAPLWIRFTVLLVLLAAWRAPALELSDLEEALGTRYWTTPKSYDTLLPQALELAQRLAGEDNPKDGRRVVTLLVMAHESPVEQLYEIARQLPESTRAVLWEGAPYAVISRFDRGDAPLPEEILNAQGRELVAVEREDGTAKVQLGASRFKDRSAYAVKVRGFRMSRLPFSVQVKLREENAVPTALLLKFWEPDLKRSLELVLRGSDEINAEGWKVLDSADTTESLYARLAMTASSALAENVYLNNIGIDVDEGEANTFRIGRIELHLPDDWETAVPDDIDVEALRGRWGSVDQASTSELDGDTESAFEALDAIGYLGSTTVEASDTSLGVTYQEGLAQPGYTLYVSGHGAAAYLIALDGTLLHEWRGDYRTLWPDEPVPESADWQGTWRRVRLMPDGGLLAIHEGRALVRIDKDSKVLWAKKGGFHHDLDIGSDGNVYVLYREPKIIPRINASTPVLEEYVMVLSPQGEEIRRVSLLECFENSFYASMIARTSFEGDIFHADTLELLDDRLAEQIPAFKSGNWLVSLKYTDTVAVVDPEALTIKWAASGIWMWQHQPTVLDNGHLLVFDNLGRPFGRRGGSEVSRVLEYDPVTREIVWDYTGTRTAPFYTKTCGSNQRLPNGNTLITETDQGRAFEVTPDGTIVWELRNPNHAGSDGSLVAAIFEAIRYPDTSAFTWLEQP